MLPKAQAKAEYDNWQGEVEIEGYNDGKYGRSFIGKIEGEKTWFNLGRGLAEDALEKGNTYNIKIGRKVGTKGWYVSEATLVGEKTTVVPTETKKTKTAVEAKVEPKTETKVEINGQAKGNYRTGLMAFICTHYQIKGEFPDEIYLERYNQLIKAGERDFWGLTETEAPADTQGLIE